MTDRDALRPFVLGQMPVRFAASLAARSEQRRQMEEWSMSENPKPASVAWAFVLLSSGVTGVLFAVLTIFGWIHGWEGRTALTILVVVGIVVFRQDLHRPIFHGFIVGFLSGLFAVELQAAFLPMYLANNPEYAVIEIPFGLPARLATAIFAPIHGIVAGSLTAGIVWILGKFSSKNRTRAAS